MDISTGYEFNELSSSTSRDILERHEPISSFPKYRLKRSSASRCVTCLEEWQL